MPNNYQFIDKNVTVGKTYFYYLEDVDIAGNREKHDVIQITVSSRTKPKAVIPAKFALLQNYPNPFNPETWLPFQLAQDVPVISSIYNQNSQLIRVIELGNKQAGIYVTKDKAAYSSGRDSLGQKVASGIYYYTLQARDSRGKLEGEGVVSTLVVIAGDKPACSSTLATPAEKPQMREGNERHAIVSCLLKQTFGVDINPFLPRDAAAVI